MNLRIAIKVWNGDRGSVSTFDEAVSVLKRRLRRQVCGSRKYIKLQMPRGKPRAKR